VVGLQSARKANSRLRRQLRIRVGDLAVRKLEIVMALRPRRLDAEPGAGRIDVRPSKAADFHRTRWSVARRDSVSSRCFKRKAACLAGFSQRPPPPGPSKRRFGPLDQSRDAPQGEGRSCRGRGPFIKRGRRAGVAEATPCHWAGFLWSPQLMGLHFHGRCIGGRFPRVV